MRPCLQAARMLFAIVLIASSALAQTVITVDAKQGIGSDFADLQAAVAAAVDGDVLLVRAGVYAGLDINGKSLVVVAEEQDTPHILGASIRNLAVDQDVVLAGLRISSTAGAGLRVLNNQGPVLVEDCKILGADGGHNAAISEDGHPGVHIVESFGVSFASCKLIGGSGAGFESTTLSSTGSGAEGCFATGPAKVALFGCEVFGGQGGHSNPNESFWGGNGAPAIRTVSTTLDVVGCKLVGGDGGDGGEDPGAFPGGPICGNGGDGGNGIKSSNGGPVTLGTVRCSDTKITTGKQGLGGFGCSHGAPGLDYEVPPGQPTELGIKFIDLDVDSPLPETDPISLHIKAPAGTALFLGVSTSIGFQFSAPLQGVALIDFATTQIIPIGIVGPSGHRNISLENSIAIPPGRALYFTTQIAGISAETTSFSIGEPASFVILDV
ncbi:MAG: hypothetical protein ACI84E_000060 [Planctomycetota bacterium]|jgi:hypothetical protein